MHVLRRSNPLSRRAQAILIGLTWCVFMGATEVRAEEVPVWEASSRDGLVVMPVSIGTYRSIQVQVSNHSSSSIEVSFPYGAYFQSQQEGYQDLAVVFESELTVRSGDTASVNLKTTCMDASKGVAPNGYPDWTPSQDAALGNVLRFYHVNRPLVEQVTGPEHHDTEEDRHNFLQLLVWTYYDGDEAHMKQFATRYIFDGDSEAANNYVDTVYPLVKTVLDLYKAGEGGGPQRLPIPMPF
jgi:hypothetical protein